MQYLNHRRQHGGIWPILILIAAVWLTACQGEPVASAAISSQPDEPTPTLQPPAVSARILPTNTPTAVIQMPAFALVDPEDIAATETAVVPTDPPPTATATETPSPTAVPTETPTPPPTFTPPALPLTSPDDHYWLRRPIADGGTVWTDKSYLYGTTRGGTLSPHHGVEFYTPTGTDILATASGVVRVAGTDSNFVFGPKANFYGNLVVVELDSRWQGQPVYTLYGHLSEILVSEGQRVNALDLIARSGASGVADGPHLHLEVRVGQNSYQATRNPTLWLYPFRDFGTVAGRALWPDGTPVEGAPVRVRRIDAESRYLATTTYVGNAVNSDDVLNENFVVDDVPVGYYEVIVDTGNKKYTEEVWVFPYRTAFVEIVIGG